ncbi:MAG: signal peptidase II [Pseudomonadota bacterium]|nr:signal peptidase II [Pseudomonadota bacterium]
MIYLWSFLVILFDQLSKIIVLDKCVEHEIVPICPLFNLFLTFNKGVSFSLFSSDSPYAPAALSAFALLVAGLLIYWIRKEKNKGARLGLALILGGAIGNVIDRIRFGAVVDFLDFYVGEYHWPAFNIADSAICIGVLILLIASFKKGEKK